MEILFNTTKIRKICNNYKLCTQKQGKRRADLIFRRLSELLAAENLSDLRRLPGPRCHELTADRKGQLSVDLDRQYRLVFEPAEEPPPVRAGGGLDWDAVKSVRILEVVDTHD